MLLKNNEKEGSYNLLDEKSKQLQDETRGDSLKKSLAIIENVPSQPKLLAWCSRMNNKISIVDLETKQEFANFDGVKLNKTGQSHTHVKEIANTGLLVSIHHNEYESAYLEVFNVSQKGRTMKIYSFEKVSGVTGKGDVTFNARRNFLGAMCAGEKTAYHLYHFGAYKSDGIVKLIRKSSWHSQYSTDRDNHITSLDFNPNGETVATFDRYGTCLISDVNTDSYHFHTPLRRSDNTARCRWTTNPDEPLLFVKYDRKFLNILDTEKKAFILKGPFEIEPNNWTYWIDVCQSDGNMLVAGGWDKNVKIFDKRESKIVQTFDGIHKDSISCVRWSPSGDMIASASADTTVALLDLKTGKKLYTGKTSDESKLPLLDL